MRKNSFPAFFVPLFQKARNCRVQPVGEPAEHIECRTCEQREHHEHKCRGEVERRYREQLVQDTTQNMNIAVTTISSAFLSRLSGRLVR